MASQFLLSPCCFRPASNRSFSAAVHLPVLKDRGGIGRGRCGSGEVHGCTFVGVASVVGAAVESPWWGRRGLGGG
jgi:hypothetical protein